MSGRQTQASALRALTALTLIRYQTIAGERVEQERTLALADGELPHLNVFMDESGEGRYQGSPSFLVTGKLQVKCTVQRARPEDALEDLDTLCWQVKEALFGEPIWVAGANQILSFGVTATFKSDDNQHHAEGLITFACQWLETVTFPGGALVASENIQTVTGQAGTVTVNVPLLSP